MPSRLANATSSYLRSAAHQPVNWYPWGAEAFDAARAADKPIVLDIGAVWCHWCHVMDGESYEHPAVADQLNRDWICVKVDRDERPDVDARYQRAVQSLSGQGGWPLTAFLTPDGDVFYGGTYFPPEAKHGQPGFIALLTELSRIFREEREKVTAQADAIRTHLAEHAVETSPGPVTEETLGAAADAMARVFDFRYGGFGMQPKFPYPTALEFVLGRWADGGDRWTWEIVERTLTAMARGGIYDQIGGGFHRYAVDARWIVPHFEKMIYDNASLLRVYALAASRTEDPAEWHAVISDTAEWILGTMSDPDGGYFASQDADVGLDDDGDYFTWTVDEARAALEPTEFAVLSRHYDIEPHGEMHHNPAKNVLWVRDNARDIARAIGKSVEDVEALLVSGRAKLREARAARPTPFIDRTLYTGWNALTASALLAATAVTGESEWQRHALATLERIFREASPDDGASGMTHVIGGAGGGILDDQVFAADAAIDAFEATGDARWLDRAVRLMDHVWATYAADDGGLYDRPAEGMDGVGLLDQPIKPIHDTPTPSGNGVAAIACARLAEQTREERWQTRHRALVSAFAGGLGELSLHGATLLLAADWAVRPATHVVVVGRRDDARADAMQREARRHYVPRRVVTRLVPGAPTDRLPPALAAAVDGKAPRAYVCVGTRCGPPADDPDQLREALTNS